MSAAPLHRHLCLVLLLGSAAACYEPNREDCTLTCASDTECLGGQVCSAQRLCAGPAVSCAEQLVNDAGHQDAGHDAAHADAHVDARPDATPIDAAPRVMLHLHADGKGRITTDLGFTCDSQDSQQHGDCTISVVAGVAVTLVAAGEANEEFTSWTGLACLGQPATCAFTPSLPLTDIHARFAKSN